jgi:hypothetical protein
MIMLRIGGALIFHSEGWKEHWHAGVGEAHDMQHPRGSAHGNCIHAAIMDAHRDQARKARVLRRAQAFGNWYEQEPLTERVCECYRPENYGHEKGCPLELEDVQEVEES